ncbi:intracellular exo-alpha-(1-_5)-L-arabinofuranosidase [Acrasis kona]|uniref:Intracellular exo-alpha-(1->5)-L-arabinofuranosidase n=1 Tax=Acrasis kona TaxID=1008807 RepID=A0AAW2Z017_9EUKA
MDTHEDKDCVLMLNCNAAKQYDLYHVSLRNMSLNQSTKNIKVRHAMDDNQENSQVVIFHDTLPVSIQKVNVWCSASVYIDPNCMIDDKHLLLRQNNVLNIINYTEDKIECSLNLTNAYLDCSDFASTHMAMEHNLKHDIYALSPNKNMFCLYNAQQRVVYAGTLKPTFKLLFRVTLPIKSEDDMIHLLPEDNLTACIVIGSNEHFYLRPMLNVYVCMKWSMKNSNWRSKISSPACVARIGNIVYHTSHQDGDAVSADDCTKSNDIHSISVKKIVDENKVENEDGMGPPRKRTKISTQLQKMQLGLQSYQITCLLVNSGNLLCVQIPTFASNEVARIVNLSDGSNIVISTNISIGSPNRKISDNRQSVIGTGKRKRCD